MKLIVIISLTFLFCFQIAASQIACSKSALARSHRNLQDNLHNPSQALIQKHVYELKQLLDNRKEASKEYYEELYQDARQVHSKMKQAAKVVNQMLTNTDRAMKDVKLLRDDSSRYDKAKAKMIDTATRTHQFYIDVVRNAAIFKDNKDLSLEVIYDLYKGMNDSINFSAQSTMEGHYYVH